MLEMPEIQVVAVCTPNYLHRDATIAACKAGKHVLCEKPIAMNAKERQEMVEAARANKVKVHRGLATSAAPRRRSRSRSS